ncbi:YjjG family noncanonical pyrimidine nucleotidase [Nonlabens antarcticus]|uniref:YjjG family noncanonical pyrimidine nucleotidase n=1 Tax=Nonlabens antarcticus TaxID=392714 RepID=UPI0018913514|nr:YjjG family noncanonical pyrimidine nucleotidase [Nonlabens antarcticus]
MSKYHDVKHLFFDLDHTLWDFDRNSKLAYGQIFENEGIDLSLDVFIEQYEPLNLEFWRRFRESEITKEELRYQRLKSTFDACNFPVEDEAIHKMADLYLEYLPQHNHLFPNCIEMLDTLKGKYQLHLITNGFDVVQGHKINNSGLREYFPYMLTAESAGIKKPDLRIFERALSDTGANAANSIMIGDSYEADILGARNAGWRTIWFHTTGQDIPEGEVVAHDLADIYSILSR